MNRLDIDKEEKAILLKAFLKEKELKILKINQKFTFKFDNLQKQKVKEFTIEIDKKNEIISKDDCIRLAL